jgi:hypothetical protein
LREFERLPPMTWVVQRVVEPELNEGCFLAFLGAY